jgi:EAL domain-containing protein (putative c-di-GMP-specific phosphodiesterase class I)
VSTALDDFGTGYASLSHLKRFPIDVINIDRQFIQNLPTDAGDQAIVRAMIGLGPTLGMIVVAEGVERIA